MKVLIAGLGCSGKSTFRRNSVEKLRLAGFNAEHYDADAFKTARCDADKDCKRPEQFDENIFYFIEDARALSERPYLPISEYNSILYVRSGLFSHMLFWLSRARQWFESGEFMWDRNTGWKGTREPKDFRNFLPIVRELLKQFWNRRRWIRDDLTALAGKRYIIVHSTWQHRKRIEFRLEI